MKNFSNRLIAACVAVFVAYSSGPVAAADPEQLTITTTDNVDLRASYYDAGTEGPAVLMIHMCRGDTDRTSWDDVARRLAAAGIHVMTFDLRGYGESAGGEPPFTTMANFIEFWRTTGMNDIDAALTQLTAQPQADTSRVGVVGASCGVFMGIDAAVRHENVRALALLSGPFDEAAAASLSSLSKTPVLGAASEDDTLAYEAMKRVFLATPHPRSRNIQYKGDAHGADMFAPEPDLKREIVDWMVYWLIGGDSM